MADRARASELSGRAADLIERHDLAEAEQTLLQALELVPDNTTCLYNLASVHAAMGRLDEAMDDLLRATDAGFTDFSQIENNPAFARLKTQPDFQKLLSRKDQIRQHAAQRVLASLKEQFGEDYLYQVDEPHRLIFAADLDRAGLNRMIEQLHLQQASQEEQIFSHPPDEFIRIVIASSADFAKQEHRYGVAGRYDDSTHMLLVKRPGPELRHEFTHALHAADQHALQQEHHVWLSEGLAVMYENARTESDKMIPADTWRLARVQAMARHNGLIPIEKLVKLDRAAFTARAELAYGESGSLLLYLHEQNLLKKFYDTYTASYAADPSGLKALTEVSDSSVDELQTRWIEWLLPRPVPTRPEILRR
jgi:tetratricopeptide (TPR) repeat protein